jgi:hypothetical protein
MGMARQAPGDTYSRKRAIYDHAILRLRERLGEGNALRHLPDWDLGNRIDTVVDTLADQSGENVLDRGDLTRVIDLGDSFEERLFAVIRVIRGRDAVLTLLTRDIVEANFTKGHWQEVEPGGLARILKIEGALPPKLGDKIVDLGKIRASLPQQPAAPQVKPAKLPATLVAPTAPMPAPAAPAPAAPAPAAPAPAAPAPAAPAPEARLVSYQTTDGAMRYAEFAKDAIPRALDDLLKDGKVNHTTVKVWREIKTRIRFEVDE